MTQPIVETRYGSVRGVIEKSSEGFQYYAFKGIPYAEPPIGQLRFKDPVPIKKWDGIKNTTEYGPNCAQYDFMLGDLSDDEDCLYLNVYANSIDKSHAAKAVMVWIHGGGFIFGTSRDVLYGPDYLIGKDIVLVTIQYRLGVFGFLHLEDEAAPGNQGLKDQVLALQWVRDNIQFFGGNPNNVTIFGESAGSSSVHYLTLSPLTKNLFHKAIAQSGVGFNPWGRVENPREKGQQLCALLGKQLEDPKEIVTFLRTVDAKKLCDTQEQLRKKIVTFPFGPGVDDKSPNPLMPLPVEILGEQGVHIPCLVGYCNREGIFFLLGYSKKEAFSMMDKNSDLMLPFRSKQKLAEYNLTPKQFRRLYYKNEMISEENCEKFVDMVGELQIIEGVHKFVKVQAEKSSTSTYMYKFSYDKGASLIKSLLDDKFEEGASHFDDIRYLFRMNIIDKIGLPHLKKGSREYKLMEQMTVMWTNFAKYGKPTMEISDLTPVHWLPITDGKILRYLNIDEDLSMQSTLNIEQKYLSAKDITI